MNAQKSSFLAPKRASSKLEPTTSCSVSKRSPKLRLHKATGQAYVVLNGKYIFFGPYGSPEIDEQYHRTIAEWHAAGKNLPVKDDQLTINQLIARFWSYVESYYRNPDGTPTSEQDNLMYVLRPVVKLYGNTPAAEFGPRCLQAVQREMVQMGWCRNNVNRSVSRIKTMFKWGVAQELLPGGVYQALQAVEGLKKGRCEARESEPVTPVPQEHIDALEPYVSRQVWAMIQLQLLTAARPGEILKIRPCDIDRSNPIWVYCPESHKTAHHGHERKIYIGPKAQEVLQSFLLRPAEAYCFSPAEARAERLAKLYANRKTPLSCGNVPGSMQKENPQWRPSEQYTVTSYRQAITRAVGFAFPAPEHLRQRKGENKEQWQKRLTKKEKAELKAWYKQYAWHPHQLRHNAATFLRKEFGLETARIILGHRSAVITEVYAEQDQQKALEVIMRVG